MRYPIGLAILLLALGGVLLFRAAQYPIYSDPTARGRLDLELFPSGKALTREEFDSRISEWYRRLHPYETPYKHLSDLGRSCLAGGIGLLMVVRFWIGYHRSAAKRTLGSLLARWKVLWAIRAIGYFWHFTLRYLRGDYPRWADSFLIGIVSEWLACLLGATISIFILRRSMNRRLLPSRIQFSKPVSPSDWLRTLFLAGWIALCCYGVIDGFPFGDEGEVYTSLVASSILLAMLCARPRPVAQHLPPNLASISPR